MGEPQYSTEDPCPFCHIAEAYPPMPTARYLSDSFCSMPSLTMPSEDVKTSTLASTVADPAPISALPTQAYLILSTKHILAFLDIMPLSRGHVLVITRNHYRKLSDVSVRVGEELGKWLPVISRAVMRTSMRDYPCKEAHWNVIQNNGERAAQTISHVHIHVIPRPPTDSSSSSTNKSASWIMFGRGQREDLDEDGAILLARSMRQEIAQEVKRVKVEEGVDIEVGLQIGEDSERDVSGRKSKL